jgi:hypothetical protein
LSTAGNGNLRDRRLVPAAGPAESIDSNGKPSLRTLRQRRESPRIRDLKPRKPRRKAIGRQFDHGVRDRRARCPPDKLRRRLRIEHLNRRMLVADLLEPQVVVGADAGQQRQLLPAQAGNPTPRAGQEPDVFGPHLLAPGPQVIA